MAVKKDVAKEPLLEEEPETKTEPEPEPPVGLYTAPGGVMPTVADLQQERGGSAGPG